jgi:hypothetical protein
VVDRLINAAVGDDDGGTSVVCGTSELRDDATLEPVRNEVAQLDVRCAVIEHWIGWWLPKMKFIKSTLSSGAAIKTLCYSLLYAETYLGKLCPSFPHVRAFLGVVRRLAYVKQAPPLLLPPAQYWVPKTALASRGTAHSLEPVRKHLI